MSEVDPILASLGSDPGEDSASETKARWLCQQVLHADVQAPATAVTDADDRDRLIQAIPDFRGIVAAYRRMCDEAM